MNQTKEIKSTWEPKEELNKEQLELAIRYLDKCLLQESNKAKVVEYCLVKVDLVNELMLLNNHSDWII